MVSFSCEVSPASSARRLTSATDVWHCTGVWGCIDKEETRRASEPLSRRILYMLRLHGPLPRHGLQVPHSTIAIPLIAPVCLHGRMLFWHCW